MCARCGHARDEALHTTNTFLHLMMWPTVTKDRQVGKSKASFASLFGKDGGKDVGLGPGRIGAGMADKGAAKGSKGFAAAPPAAALPRRLGKRSVATILEDDDGVEEISRGMDSADAGWKQLGER